MALKIIMRIFWFISLDAVRCKTDRLLRIEFRITHKCSSSIFFNSLYTRYELNTFEIITAEHKRWTDVFCKIMLCFVRTQIFSMALSNSNIQWSFSAKSQVYRNWFFLHNNVSYINIYIYIFKNDCCGVKNR